MFVFIAFFIHEGGHMSTVLFGTFLYMPYVFMLSGLNIILTGLGLIKMAKRPLLFLTVSLTSIVLIIWSLVNGGKFTIRYWEFTLLHFVILNTVIIGLNLWTARRLTKEKQHDTI